MANEFIARKSAVGLGKELTAGTSVSPEVWIPKTSWVLNPEFEEAVDDSGYGVIDEVYDTQTTKNFSKITLWGIARDDFLGYLLLGALGTYTPVECVELSWVAGGTVARWDVVNDGASWTGVIKKITSMGTTPTTYYWISTTGGTLANGAVITDGTWTGGTVDLTTNAAAKGHLFERANTNNHQTFTLYDDDPIASAKSPYSMINTFELSTEVGDYVKFTAEFWGKKMTDGWSLSPAYSDENPFLASMANVYFATNEAGLNAATASCMQNFRLSINKNLTDIQCFGTQDINSLHNQQFTTEWDFEALYSDVVLRDYVVDSEKKACRFEVINDEAGALVAGQIFPSLICDFAKVGFKEWTKTDSNNDIVKQTLGYSGQYDNTTSMQIEILLINSQATGY